MNEYQALQQIKSVLEAATWPGGDAGSLFGSVVVSAGLGEQALGRLRFPFAVISPGDSTGDADDERYLTGRVSVTIVQRVYQDAVGETAIIGGGRSQGDDDSAGRGLLEIQEIVMQQIGDLRRLDGFDIDLRYSSAVAAVDDPDIGGVVSRQLEFEAMFTRDRYYPPALKFEHDADVLSNWRANILGAITRYDLVAYQLRYLAGTTAPADTTEGTSLAFAGSVGASSIVFAPQSGTNSYSIFLGYDTTGDGSADTWSDAASFTKAG